MSLSACASAPPSNECCARSRVTADATLQTAGPRNSPQGRLIGIDCSNEDHDPSIRAYIDWMRWRSPESADKMRRSIGGFIKSVCHTQARGGGDGNGPEQPLLRKLNAERTAGAPVTTSATATVTTTIQATPRRVEPSGAALPALMRGVCDRAGDHIDRRDHASAHQHVVRIHLAGYRDQRQYENSCYCSHGNDCCF
jgi:hypothetical protein